MSDCIKTRARGNLTGTVFNLDRKYQSGSYTARTGTLETENLEKITGLSTSGKETFDAVLEAISHVHRTHGVGYTADIYGAILQSELDHVGLAYENNPVVAPHDPNLQVNRIELPVLLISAFSPHRAV